MQDIILYSELMFLFLDISFLDKMDHLPPYHIYIWLYFFTYIKCSILFTDHGRGKGKEERNEKETVRLIHAVNMKCAPTSAWRFSFSFENYKRAAFKSSFSVQGCSSYEDIQRPECGDKNWF